MKRFVVPPTKNLLLISFLLPFVGNSLFSQGSVPSQEIFLPFPESQKTEDSGLEQPTQTVSSQPSTTSTLGKESQDTTSAAPSSDLSSNSGSVKESAVASTQKQKNGKNKKKGKGEGVDPTEPPYQRGKAFLTRNQKKNAETEFSDSYSKEGEKSSPSRVENTNLFGLDSKDKEGSSLVDKQEDPDLKIKTQFELARSLDRVGNPESEEKAYKEYLKLVTQFPVHSEITPRAHYAIAVLLFRKKEYRPSLHHLVKLIKDFKESKERSSAYYYAGRIYESAWPERDLEKAKKYYDLYLAATEGKVISPGYDFRKEVRERRNLIESFP
ncbi:tetratricopeptide repeat protein [Leptospira idonii]|uniref:Tetratricopeptide repeat protein n=1 Tax=Leptospira idonii TaxID=1193500 RepID=A0A4R9M5R0_9LEPT|nr:tetratricopeptide repeat protein [Leptospira idonii]